jgi:spermidine synthase
MPRFFKYRAQQKTSIELSELDGIRSLHLGGTMVQSAMRLSAPNDLELAYTQYMMGFLLFHSEPKNICMIGLGGGSLAKFVYHQMPQAKTTVIEINPQIITTARNHFFLPDDDERLQILVAEGGEYLANHHVGMDVLLIDGFDNDCQVPSLCSQGFYNHVRQVLDKNGVLVVNLLSRDKRAKDYLQRIKNSFNGHVVTMMSEARGNLIVFAFRNSPGKLTWKALRIRAKSLEKEYFLPFSEFVAKLRKHNSHSHQALEI